ncbi:hypothetical protein D3C76_1601020 [compost metagenome]
MAGTYRVIASCQPVPKPESWSLNGLYDRRKGRLGPVRSLPAGTCKSMARLYWPVRWSTWFCTKLWKLVALL